MRLLSKLIGFALMMMIVPLVTLAACNAAVFSALTSPNTYVSTFEDTSIYEDLIPLAMPAVFRAANQNLNNELIFFADRAPAPIQLAELNRILSSGDWRAISNQLIPPQWLKKTFEQALSVILAILEGDLSVLDQTIDVTEVRSRLLGTEAQRAADLIMNSLPACTAAQMGDLGEIREGAQHLLPLCRPDDDEALLAESRQMIVGWMESLANNLQGDEIRVGDLFPRDNARVLSVAVDFDRQVNALFYLCPSALASLMLVFTIRSWRSFGRWIGTTLFLCAAAIIALTIMGQAFVIDSASTILREANTSTDIDRFFSQILVGLFRSGFLEASGVLLTQAALLGSLGFLLLALTVWFPSRRVRGQRVIITEDGQVFSTASGQPVQPSSVRR